MRELFWPEFPTMYLLDCTPKERRILFIAQRIDGAGTAQLQTVNWCDSPSICCLVDTERLLGHIVRAGMFWLAFDSTHLNKTRTQFRLLGACVDIRVAKFAVQEALKVTNLRSKAKLEQRDKILLPSKGELSQPSIALQAQRSSSSA